MIPNVYQTYANTFCSIQKIKLALTKAIEERNYEKIAKEYKLIENQGKKVIVPFNKSMPLYRNVREEMLNGNLTPGLVKCAARITVNTFEKDIEKYCEPNLLF